MIRERLFQDFREMVKIPSPSGHENMINTHIIHRLEALGARVEYDPGEGGPIGSDGGNIYAFFSGDPARKTILLSAHTDTVTPTVSLEPGLSEGKITGDGTHILGADDKAAIAVIFELLRAAREEGFAHPPIEIALSISEETGLLGASLMDITRFSSKEALVLDMSGTEKIGYAAVGARDIIFDITGKASHAGWAIDEGVNAILGAASLIRKMKTGTVDEESVFNIGLIEGGEAVNIVPERTRIRGEIRSFREGKMDVIVRKALEAAKETEKEFPGMAIDVTVKEKYKPYQNDPKSPLIIALQNAGNSLGRPQSLVRCKGGSDANIFNYKGLESVVLSIGMEDVHSSKEYIYLDDMVRLTEFLIVFLKERK
ncbi:M20/M25/M40 family metallo-hydrolase [Candidatus Mcinerneyibacteriota bacterium]|nr:M20/M25/M40 family metallo-hydrolase [Candidatus Mcinerneyibacteriota bacterium]